MINVDDEEEEEAEYDIGNLLQLKLQLFEIILKKKIFFLLRFFYGALL